MIKKLFKNNLFIFTFTFAIEFIVYYFFNHLNLFGRYIIPDMALSPFFGLIFGPVGGLGQALATLISELKGGCDPIVSILDSLIMFSISIVSYKFWYLFNEKDLSVPKLDSMRNILKFLATMFMAAITYWILLRISFLAFPDIMDNLYSIIEYRHQLSYSLNIFNFSIIFGFIFINIFHIFNIPFKKPAKIDLGLKIRYRYFAIPLGIFFIYSCLNIEIQIINYIMFIAAFICIFLFAIDYFNVGKVKDRGYYSIIEKIIFGFIIIMFFSFAQLVDDFFNVLCKVSPIIRSLDVHFIWMIVVGILMFSAIIATLLHIYFVERIITNPINQLNSAVNNYVKDNKLSNQTTSFNFKGLRGEDDITRLFNSFNKLTGLITKYMDDLKQTVSAKERLETEFNIAKNIQSNMLSKDFDEFSKIGPFKIHAFMTPAREVGGDFYDYFKIDDNHIGFAIGDVSGKGISAALFMVKIMYLIKNHSKFQKHVCDIMEHVNNLSCEKNDENLFVTSWFGKLNFKTGNLYFVNAGHNHPLIMRNNGEFEYLQSDSNIVLGIMENMQFSEEKLILNPGDTIFLYTDGITEANNNYNEFYGEERLKNVLNKNKNEDLDKIISEIKKDIDEFCNYQEQFDDETMFIIRFEGKNNV